MLLCCKCTSDLNKLIEENYDKLIVIRFHGMFCYICQNNDPEIYDIGQKDNNLLVVCVNVEECGELDHVWGINIIPTFIFVKRGIEVERTEEQAVDKIRELIKKHQTQ